MGDCRSHLQLGTAAAEQAGTAYQAERDRGRLGDRDGHSEHVDLAEDLTCTAAVVDEAELESRDVRRQGAIVSVKRTSLEPPPVLSAKGL